MECVQSRHHPGEASYGLVAARAQAVPVAVVFLILMIVAVSAALQGVPVLRPLLVAVPVAYVAAAAGGLAVADRRVAEVCIDGPFAALRSPLDIARASPPRLRRVHSVQLRREGLLVGLGDTIRVLDPLEWADPASLRRQLQIAAHTPDAGVSLS